MKKSLNNEIGKAEHAFNKLPLLKDRCNLKFKDIFFERSEMDYFFDGIDLESVRGILSDQKIEKFLRSKDLAIGKNRPVKIKCPAIQPAIIGMISYINTALALQSDKESYVLKKMPKYGLDLDLPNLEVDFEGVLGKDIFADEGMVQDFDFVACGLYPGFNPKFSSVTSKFTPILAIYFSHQQIFSKPSIEGAPLKPIKQLYRIPDTSADYQLSNQLWRKWLGARKAEKSSHATISDGEFRELIAGSGYLGAQEAVIGLAPSSYTLLDAGYVPIGNEFSYSVILFANNKLINESRNVICDFLDLFVTSWNICRKYPATTASCLKKHSEFGHVYFNAVGKKPD